MSTKYVSHCFLRIEFAITSQKYTQSKARPSRRLKNVRIILMLKNRYRFIV